MTRPRGTIPVTLARHRALVLADWIERYRPPEPTVLGSAGMTEQAVMDARFRDSSALVDMVLVLRGRKAGRHRNGVSTYYLSRQGILLLYSPHVALSLPRELRPVVKAMIRKARIKRGPKLPVAVRERNLQNGGYAPETARRYRYEIRKTAERRAASEAVWANSEAKRQMEKPLEPGSPAAIIRALIGATRLLD